MNRSIHPSAFRILGERLLVKAYVRPQQYGSILLPDSHAKDTTGTIWEVVKLSAKAEQRLGVQLREGELVKSRPLWPPSSGYDDERDGRAMFFLEAEQVSGVIPWLEPIPKEEDHVGE